jgi:2-amino-4-hydroxy-6-hydroxymethyldihydropteridine diphosphokinase
MIEPVTVYIGIGSNMDSPLEQVKHAMLELNSLPETHCIRQSACYCSAPMGPQDQPDYINAVVALETRLSPKTLLRQLQILEKSHGRVRDGSRWGPRTLDLDILLYADEVIDVPGMQIPHPGILQRNFVLFPLYEVAPEIIIPGVGRLQDVIRQCSPDGLMRLEDS